MAGFNGFLDATFASKKLDFDADLVYQCDIISQDEINSLRECKVRVTDDGKIIVPAGYITDLASVPALRGLLFLPLMLPELLLFMICYTNTLIHNIKPLMNLRLQKTVPQLKKNVKCTEKLQITFLRLL